MAFLDKLKAAGSVAAEKAKDTAEIGKLKLRITGVESDIKGIYAAVGKKLMEENSELAKQNFAEEMAKLEELKAQIAELNAQIAAVKETPAAAEDCADVTMEVVEEEPKAE